MICTREHRSSVLCVFVILHLYTYTLITGSVILHFYFAIDKFFAGSLCHLAMTTAGPRAELPSPTIVSHLLMFSCVMGNTCKIVEAGREKFCTFFIISTAYGLFICTLEAYR